MKKQGLVAALLCLQVLTSCAKNPQAPDPSLAFGQFAQVDFPEDWSHDGKLIAFRRPFPSTYGPPGIYLISPDGGLPRWLCPATYYYPGYVRFSPNDRYLAAVVSDNITIIDTQTGAAWQPMYTNSVVFSLAWLPDGGHILYYRVSNIIPDTPPDSGWLHVLDITTSEDVPIHPDGRNASLTGMRTGPDGRILAVENLETTQRLVMLDPVASHLRSIYEPGQYPAFSNPQWWLRPRRGIAAAIFEMRRLGYVGWTVPLVGGEPRRFAQSWNSFTLMSPDGERFVCGGADVITHYGILDIMLVDDLSSASRRHLTGFASPNLANSGATVMGDR